MAINNRLKFIEKARAQAFTQPLWDQYHFHSVPLEIFWEVYSKEFHQHSPLDLFFEEEKLRNSTETGRLQLINDSTTHTLADNFLLLDKNKNIIAMMRGWQKNYDSYYMQFTAVHTNYRRQGIYSALIDRVVQYTKLLGFSRILSCHAPFNNAVLIAKLKKDFNIIGVEVDAALGINIWLCYFHNLELKKAFELRCGNITCSEKLAAASLGTIEQLYIALKKSINE